MRTNGTNEQPAANHRNHGSLSGDRVALARVFAQHGHELALIARREDRLHALADEIAATGARRPMVIAADLLKAGAGRLIGEALAAQGAEPQFFVNNAGFGLVGLASARDRDEQLEMIDLNVRALTELSFAFVDSLARHRGGLGPSILTQSADYMAAAGYRGLMAGHRTVVPGFINKLITILIRIIPRRLVLRVVDSRQSRRRSAQQT
jgi:short-subunit dehydrogenase